MAFTLKPVDRLSALLKRLVFDTCYLALENVLFRGAHRRSFSRLSMTSLPGKSTILYSHSHPEDKIRAVLGGSAVSLGQKDATVDIETCPSHE